MLAQSAVPHALDHADLHGTNVLFNGESGRIIDWGGCCITHPFSTLFVVFSFVVAQLNPSDQADASQRLRDLYLAPWGGTTPTNVRAFDLAIWVAHVTRALGQAEEGDADADAEVKSLLDAWLDQADAVLI